MAGSKIEEIQAIGEELAKREFAEESAPAEPEFETWDNEHFRERMREILLSARVMDVSIEKIQIPAQGLAKFQFRRTRAKDALKDSIKANGVLEPILLQQAGEVFFVVDGHGRLAAWQEAAAEAELPKPVFLVIDISVLPDPMAMQLAAELNLNSQNLSSEDADTLMIRLFEQGKMRQIDIAALTRKSKGYVSEVIAAFRDVPPEARALVESGVWTVKHGRELARLVDSPDEQKRIMRQAIQTHYDATTMEEKVDSAKAKLKWTKQAESRLKAAPPEGQTPGKEIRMLTKGQVERIHRDLVKETTEIKRTGYGGHDKQVARMGTGEYEPTPVATGKILKKMGYEIVEGEAPSVTEETVKLAPKMPSNDELMQESEWEKSICPFCKGRTHQVVAEELDFKTERSYGMNAGTAHRMCIIQDRVAFAEKELKKAKAQLDKDDLYRLIQSGKMTLEQVNVQSHAIYKRELEARKQAWREKNLTQKAPKKTAKTEETVAAEEQDFELLVAQVREKNPKLVPPDHDYWDAYLRYKRQDEGWESIRNVAERLGIKSHGSVLKQFQKLDKAVAAEGAQ